MEPHESLQRFARRAAFGAAAALCALAAAPAAHANTRAKAKVQVTTEAETVGYRVRSNALAGGAAPALDMSRFAFTAPGRAAPQRLVTVGRTFRFTPSGSADRKALALGVTSRVLGPAPQTGGVVQRAAAPATDATVAPAGYNVDLSAEWKGFALSGGVMRLDEGLAGGRREGVDVGLGYRASRWRAALQATAERGGPAGAPLLIDRARAEPRYAFEASGAFALSPKLSVSAGARYRMAPDGVRALGPTLIDPAAEDRAVFVGGSLAF